MSNGGTGFGVNLYDLWRVGRRLIPTVALVCTTANRHVVSADDGLDTTLFRPSQFSG